MYDRFMSKPRFRLYAEVDTLAHANTIKTALSNQLVGKDIFEKHSLFSGLDPLVNKNVIIAEWRFNNNVDRDALKDWVKDQIENHPQVKVWVTKANVSWHECSHSDLEIKDCTTTNYFEWSKS